MLQHPMLRLAILNQDYVLLITLVNITYQSGDQYLTFIHSWDSGLWWVLYILLFFFFLRQLFKVVFRVVLATLNKIFFRAYIADQFLVPMKVSFFSNLSFCPSFKSLLLLLSLLI